MVSLVQTIRNKGHVMDEQVEEAVPLAELAQEEEQAREQAPDQTPEQIQAQTQAQTQTDAVRAIKPSDRHKLVADISVFHYKRLRMVASERGIPVGELLEELIDRMWTYRSG